ncbi:MAG: VOC family protein [Rhizobiaceae bacterium]|nr:VOC family protein [Rhizobiaceae bacterium]
MRTERCGLVLHTERYEACVAFYRDVVGLRVEFEKDEPGQVLTIFDFGGAYLMLERDGLAVRGRKTKDQNPATLRLNVVDLDGIAASLRDKGLDVSVARFEWGAIADLCDPDGNRCQLRETGSFGR